MEQLPASEIETAVELLQALVEAPVDPAMLARINAARQAAIQERGVGIPHEEVLKEFGLLKRFAWEAAARAGLRRLDRDTAMKIG